jgi:hypothetical protein
MSLNFGDKTTMTGPVPAAGPGNGPRRSALETLNDRN